MPLRRLDIGRPEDVLTLTWALAHPRETICRYLRTPEKLAEWLGRPLAFDPQVGGEIIVDHADDYLCRCEVLSASESAAELSWTFPDEPSSRISLRLAGDDAAELAEDALLSDDAEKPVANASVLTLQHRGLGPLIDSYATGWLTHLTYFEASVGGSPLPFSQFWTLCATFDALLRRDEGQRA